MKKKRVHILALGDVGATLATGLVLLGGNDISVIGLYDAREEAAERCAIELGQIAMPFEPFAFPAVERVRADQLFECDVFVFCASKGVPPVGAAIADVRMAQLEGNAKILAPYARLASAEGFSGLFAVVSDPVDLLCQCAYYESGGLRPEQIRGYGLGVMHARALYYAKRDIRFMSYLDEGRAYGPHGEGLIIANSVSRYDEGLSMELTELALNANKGMRALGFKPYIAPALSSGALSILLTLRGEWHYSAVYDAILDGGIYWGCKNRETAHGPQMEAIVLPAPLQARIRVAKDRLWEEGARWRCSS